jgi:hypothetical protein
MRTVAITKKPLIFLTLAVVVLIASATTTEAQGFRRRGFTRVAVVGGYYPYAYANPFWFGDPLYGYGYPWRPYGPFGYYGFPEASVRLEVTPRDAEVYIDGYYAGVVDDFDGAFQRLHVEPGEHEIEVFREGYRPFRQKVYLTPDNTFKIRQALPPLAAGEQPEPRPQPQNPPPAAQGGQPSPQPAPGMPAPRGRAGRRIPPPPPGSDPRSSQPPDPRGGQSPSGYGTLVVRVQPADAEVSIDGEPWRGPGGQDRLVIDVSEGSHTVEIRKPGFRTYVTQAEVRRGETSTLNVSLRNEQ